MKTKEIIILTMVAVACMSVACFACYFIGRSDGQNTQQINHREVEPLGELRSYQIETYNDSTVIWDGFRKVGVLGYDSSSKFDQLINFDNQ